MSVKNQKQILKNYARKKVFTNIRRFSDGGARGTTFRRPGLARYDEGQAELEAAIAIWQEQLDT